jgi:hypothetical protein
VRALVRKIHLDSVPSAAAVESVAGMMAAGFTEAFEEVLDDAMMTMTDDGTGEGGLGVDGVADSNASRYRKRSGTSSGGDTEDANNAHQRHVDGGGSNGGGTVVHKLQCARRELRRRGVRNLTRGGGGNGAEESYYIHVSAITSPPGMQKTRTSMPTTSTV